MTRTLTLSRDATRLPKAARGAVVALDGFQGLHLGQQALAEAAVRAAAARGAAALAVAWPPADPAAPGLFSLRALCRELAGQGVGHLHLPRPCAPSPAALRTLLVERLAVAQVILGAADRPAGEAAAIAALGRTAGFETRLLEPATAPDGQVCGSAALGAALAEGALDRVAALCGRPWEIEGRVRQGDRRGRTIGFPTANLGLGRGLQPALGVYAVRVLIERPGMAHWHDGAANLGRRPTVGGLEPRLEVHLFDFAGDLYGARLRVQLLAYLRGEKKFDGLAGLQAQIAADCQAARRILGARA